MKCCFCGKKIERKNAHNPEDFGLHSNPTMKDSCCEICNLLIVIPNRMLKSDYIEKGLEKEDVCNKLISYFSSIKKFK